MSDAPKEPRSYPHIFTMLRQEGIGFPTNITLLRFFAPFEDPCAAWQRFLETTTEWLESTVEGQAAWHESVEDFNIGDFGSYVDVKGSRFSAIASARGLTGFELLSVPAENIHNYDEILHTRP